MELLGKGLPAGRGVMAALCVLYAVPVFAGQTLVTVTVYDPATLGLYAVPGNDVIYTVNVKTGAREARIITAW